MEKVHVLITAPLSESDIEKVTSVDPRIEVIYAAEEVRVERGIAATEVIPWGRPMGQRELTLEEASATLDGMLEHVEVVLGWRLPRNLLSRAPRLKWVQGVGAGLDLMAGDTGLLQSDVLLSNASGTNAAAVAEFALCLMLMLVKQAPRFLSSQQSVHWDHSFATGELRGKTAGIIGLGEIGGRIAGLSRAFGMRVLGIKRSAKGEQEGSTLDKLYSLDELDQMLPECDFVILAVPLTSETRAFIGEAAFKAMKPTAYIVNVARGPVIDQEELVRALKEGWIAGAALDVFEKEPLPTDSELWRLPNVIVSPHIAGYVEKYNVAVTRLFCDNLKRFLHGERLHNLFDKDREY